MANHVYANAVKGLIGDFEAKSGMKVTLELLAFDVHNQRADLELASGSGSIGLHWVWPTYLYSYGGTFFANPPADLTPTLNSKESVTATTVFDRLSTE